MNKRIIIGGLAGVLFGMPVLLRSFETQQTEQFVARVVIQGLSPSQQIHIRHVPIQGISPVTDQAFIQGEAGTGLKSTPLGFPARFTPDSPPVGGLPTDEDGVRVTVQYRIENPDHTFSPIVTLPSIEGPNPLPFSFQLNPADIDQASNVQYQIRAERVRPAPGGDIVVGVKTFPPGALADPDLWQNVGIVAQAADAISVQGGRVIIPDGNPNDGETTVDVPANMFSAPATISINEVPLSGQTMPFATPLSGPLAMYEFQSNRPFNGAVKATLLYPDFIYPLGQDGILDGTTFPESRATAVWWDGKLWRPLGSSKDPELNTLTLRVTNNMNLIAIIAATVSSASDNRPAQRVITPNGDSANDSLDFTFLDQVSEIRVEIFDITGQRIRSLAGVGTVPWNGRNDSGEVVESGVYIYQYTDSGERISGLVAVAK